MKLKSKDEIDAPIAHVFAHLQDADRLEQVAKKRGVPVKRSPQAPVAPGTRWDATIKFKGAKRKLGFTLDQIEAPELLSFSGGTDGMDLWVRIDLVALTPNKTRMIIETEAKPRSLAARLLIQSARLAKGRMETRYRDKTADFAQKIADSFVS